VDVRPGTGLLEVIRVPRGSVISRAYATSPLRLLTPRSHGRAAWVYSGSYGGGLVGGDALTLTMSVGAGATAFLSTQASTKVYRSELGTSVVVDARVREGGQLVVWPDPVVCFAASSYRQRQHFELEADTTLVLVDWMTSGRRASGERWRFERYSTRITVRYDGKLVLVDSVSLSAAEGDLIARMGRFDVLCTAAVVGPRLQEPIRRILQDVSQTPVQRNAAVLIAASPLQDTGCILRIAGGSVEQVGCALRHHLSFVSGLLGDDPSARKW
jgi:urease accessory protein